MKTRGRNQKVAVGDGSPQESLLKCRKLGRIWHQLACTCGKLWRSMSASGSGENIPLAWQQGSVSNPQLSSHRGVSRWVTVGQRSVETIGSTMEFIYQEEYGGEECISIIQFTHFSCSVTQFHNYRYAGIIGGDGKRTHVRTSSKVESGIKCSALRKYCRDVPPGKTCTFIGWFDDCWAHSSSQWLFRRWRKSCECSTLPDIEGYGGNLVSVLHCRI